MIGVLVSPRNADVIGGGHDVIQMTLKRHIVVIGHMHGDIIISDAHSNVIGGVIVTSLKVTYLYDDIIKSRT